MKFIKIFLILLSLCSSKRLRVKLKQFEIKVRPTGYIAHSTYGIVLTAKEDGKTTAYFAVKVPKTKENVQNTNSKYKTNLMLKESDKDKDAKESIQQEAKILNYLAEDLITHPKVSFVNDLVETTTESENQVGTNKPDWKAVVESKFAVKLNEGNDLIVLKRYDCDALKFSKVLKCKGKLKKYSQVIIGKMIKDISFLHNKNVIHVDIKPENFLVKVKDDVVTNCDELNFEDVKKDFHLAVSDFGTAIIYKGDPKTKQNGTTKYMSPEVAYLFEGEIEGCRFQRHYIKGYDLSADIYSLGVVMLEMETDLALFSGLNEEEIEDYKTVTQKISKSIDTLPDGKMKDLISQMIHKIPNYRPTISEVKKKFKEIVKEKNTAKQAKKQN